MDEAWERAVEAALEGQAEGSSSSSSVPRTLTLDGAVKCLHGRLPPPGLLERYQALEHLSIANVGVSSLEKFPRLRNLQRLSLSDNRIAGGLEFLVEAGLHSLRDLDLSNNRIQFLEDLAPLAHLRLVSLDLYECPITRVQDYRAKVFAMIRSLKYLDKMDADENERPETDEEDDEEEDEDEEEDPGSGEIDGEDRTVKAANGVVGGVVANGIVDVDEDDESDADEEETETVRAEVNGSARGFHHHLSNGFRVEAVGQEDDEEEEEDVEDDDVDDEDHDEDPGEEIDEEDGEDEDVVVVHDIVDSDEDGVEEEEDVEEEDDDEADGDGDGDGDEDEDEEDVEDEEEDGEPGSTARITSTDGEIDGHEQGEDDENGEIGEEGEPGVDEEPDFEEDDGDGEDEEEDLGGDYRLQQHVARVDVDAGGSDLDACNGEEDEDGVDDDHEEECRNNDPSSSSQLSKRKRGGDDDVDDDCVEDSRSSKHR